MKRYRFAQFLRFFGVTRPYQGRISVQSPSRRNTKRFIAQLEALEDRSVPANLYVDLPSAFTITRDVAPSGFSNGDTVTWNGTNSVNNLTVGTNAFGSVSAAVTASSTSDNLFLASQTYSDGIVTVLKNNLKIDVPTGASGFSLQLGNSLSTSSITLTGGGSIKLVGNQANNTIVGNSGNNVIDATYDVADILKADPTTPVSIPTSGSGTSVTAISPNGRLVSNNGDNYFIFRLRNGNNSTATVTAMVFGASSTLLNNFVLPANTDTYVAAPTNSSWSTVTLIGSGISGFPKASSATGNFSLAAGADDTLTGGLGDDTITGGAGTDTAVYSGNYSDYTISVSGSTATIKDTRNGSKNEGTDTLTTIEKLQFSDQTVRPAPSSLGFSVGTDSKSVATNLVFGSLLGNLTATTGSSTATVTMTLDGRTTDGFFTARNDGTLTQLSVSLSNISLGGTVDALNAYFNSGNIQYNSYTKEKRTVSFDFGDGQNVKGFTTLNPNSAPVFSSADNTSVNYGQNLNFTISASGSPTYSIPAGSLPSGITLNQSTGALSGIAPAGTYNFIITATSGGQSTTQPFTLTVNKVTVTVTADAKSKTYGAADPTLTYTYSGLVNGDTSSVFSGSLTRSSGETVAGDPYAILLGTLSAGSNYNISYVGANFTINTATVTVTAAAKSKTYGASDPALTYSFTGLVNGDTSSVFSGSLTRVAGESVAGDPYAITKGTLSAGTNYTISYVGANFTINTATVTVTADAKSKIYGASDPTLTYSYTGLVNGDTAGVFTGNLTRVAGETVAGDPYAISKGTLSAGGNYTISFVGANFTINTATVTVSAAAKSKIYGAADPALTYSFSGLVNGDTASVFTGSLTRVAGETVAGGPYAISKGTLSAGGNYTISFVGANFTINTATVTVTADAKSKTYGAADPVLTYTFSGLVNGDTSSVFTGNLTRDAGETVAGDPYAITKGTLSAGGNYTISFVGANFTINTATVTVTATAKSKIYGAADPALTYTFSGLVNGDTSSVFSGSLTRVVGETVAGGPYAISKGTLSAGGNYTISFVGANFIINTATVTVTADAKSKPYGAADPALTYTFSGLVNGDTSSVFTGSLTRVAGETVAGDPYAITKGTLSAGGNYTISFVGANFTINTATVTVTATAKSKIYGAADPALTYTFSGLVNGDTASVFKGNLTRVAGETVAGDPYAINKGTLSAGSNYTISFIGANFTITTATVTVTADTKSKTYGAADPALTYTFSGLVNGDTSSVFTGNLTRVAGETVAGDPYAITKGTLSAGGNYTISYVGANFTINTATVIVTATAKSKIYGAADPALTYTFNGLVNGDTASVFTGSLTRVAGETVAGDPYAITKGTLSAGSNYTISFIGANFTITTATVTVTADAKSKTYGAADPALTYTFSGLVNGDTSSVFTGSLTRVAGETVAGDPYAITKGTLSAGGNYTISFVGANFTINTATVTVTATAKSKTYGSPDPALTYNFTGLVNGDTSSVFTGSLTRVAGETVAGDPYAITKGTLSAGSNYTISFIGANFTITTATVTITADAKSKTYGAADPALTYNFSGLVNGDTASVFTGSLTRVAGETVAGDPYAITKGTLSAGSNYTISFIGANFTITTATVTVTADAKAKTYGASDPALTYTFSGLVNGDTSSVFTGSLTRVAGETVAGDPYAITKGTLSAGTNYTISFVGADFTITPATLNVTAVSKTKVYGSSDPALTYNFSGLVNGDNASVFTGGLARTAGETVAGDPYSINQGTLSAGSNYNISYFPATFIITPATLTIGGITANNKPYDGTTVATLNTGAASFNGLFGFDQVTMNLSGLAANFSDKNVGTNKPVTITGITLGGADAGNYALTQPSSSANITRAGLTIAAKSVTGTYGQISLSPTTGFTATGLGAGDRIESVSLTTDATLSSSGNFIYRAVPWTITASTATGIQFDSANYTIQYQTGNLTVNRRSLTVSAIGIDKVYDGSSITTVSLDDDRVSGDKVDDSYTDARFTDSPNAGTNKPIQVLGVSISGADSGNYLVVDDILSTRGRILPKSIKYTLPDNNHPYSEPVELNLVIPAPQNQAGSAFYSTPVDVTRFTTRFTFQTSKYTRTPGDGITFTMQGQGSGVVGANGEGLGYQGIGNSVAIKFDLIDNYGEGTSSTGLYINGVNPSKTDTPSQPLWNKGIDLQSDHVFAVEMNYDGSKLLVTVVDTKLRISSVQSYNIDIPAVLGRSTAFVGFTGGTGTLTSRQTILSWDYKNGATKVIDYADGFSSNDSSLDANGSAFLRNSAIMLTGANKAFDINTGVNGESLVVFLSSPGNEIDSPVGTYPINGALYDSTGLASNYMFDYVPGNLTVTKKAVTFAIPDQAQIYGTPINLNAGWATNPVNQAGSAFYDQLIDISGGFQTAFTFQTNQSAQGPGGGPSTIADGITFTIQRKGTGALGQFGEGLGYQGITKSIAIKFDNYNNTGEGRSSTGLFVGGVNPSNTQSSTDLLSSGIDLTRDDPVSVLVSYNATTKALKVDISQNQTTTGGVITNRASQTYSIDIGARILGNTAYFGFTGGTGTLSSRQEITQWTIGTNGQSRNILDRSLGFNEEGQIFVNGTADVSGGSLVLTCFPDSTRISVGSGDEYLNLYQTSNGNTGASKVGDYRIDGRLENGTGAVSNYDVNLIPGKLTVRKANLNIKVKDLNGFYGQIFLNNQTGFTPIGIANNEIIGSVVLTSNATRSNGGFMEAGAWTIDVSGATGGTFDPNNYNITYTKGYATIQQASLTIKANDRAKVYGDKLELKGTEFTKTTMVEGDTVDWVSLGTNGDIAGANAGNYLVSPSKAQGKGLKNYKVSYEDGSLVVSRKNLTYTIGDRTQNQGSPVELNPLFPNPNNLAGSVFYQNAVNITNFRSTFTFQTTQIDKLIADGFTFTIQNQGLSALGLRGEGLGYQGIGKSVAIKFDMFNNSGEGNNSTGLYLNGANPSTKTNSVDLTGSNIDFQSLHPFQVDMIYRNLQVTVTITDQATGRSATQSYSIDLPAAVGGSTAFVGFTGATGGLVAKQAILSWNFKQNTTTTIFNYDSGFAGANGLVTNGSAMINGSNLALTAPSYGAIISTGVGDEKLYLYLNSLGNTALATIGTYLINGNLIDASGSLSNYNVVINQGKLSVV